MTTLDQLNEFLAYYDQEPLTNVRIIGRRAYYVPEQVRKLSDQVKADPFSVGVPLGEATPAGFRPSFAVLDLLTASENFVVVTDDAEWMFLCARDIFEENVTKDNAEKEFFLVKNRHGGILGIGKWFHKGKKRMVKAVLDRGDFLRREEKRKKNKPSTTYK